MFKVGDFVRVMPNTPSFAGMPHHRLEVGQVAKPDPNSNMVGYCLVQYDDGQQWYVYEGALRLVNGLERAMKKVKYLRCRYV